MNLTQAKDKIGNAWLISALAIVAFYVCRLLDTGLIYMFLPWVFPSNLEIPLLVIVLLLTFLVYMKNRIGATLLFVFYLLDRIYVFMSLAQLGGSAPPGMLPWAIISLQWGIIFVQGIRGTFTYHRLKNRPLVTSMKPG